MPTALDLAANYTGSSTTEAQQKTWITALRAALAEMGDPMGRHGAVQNLSLAFSVAANALTCNVKTRAGATASATDPISAALRNATLATGDFNVRNITAALSLVISSGSTLGHQNATPGFIYWYLIDNAGTLELAASTTYLGVNGIVTTVAEGGAGAADSVTVTYSTTARSTVAFICVGRTTDTQTTAGTWTALPSAVELAPLDVLTGTWTPSLGGTTTYTTQTGTYTKIGRLVAIDGHLTINTIGTGSTTSISGLPFANAADFRPIAVGPANSLATAVVSIHARVDSGTAVISVASRTAAATSDSFSAIFGNGTDLYFNGVYHV